MADKKAEKASDGPPPSKLASAVLQELVSEDANVGTRYEVLPNGRRLPTRVSSLVHLRFFTWRLVVKVLKTQS